MGRYARRVDGNQTAIVRALRSCGCTVQSLARLGDGVPDLLVACHGRNHLIEIKVPGETLTPREHAWHLAWPVPVWIVTSVDEALQVLDVCAYNVKQD